MSNLIEIKSRAELSASSDELIRMAIRGCVNAASKGNESNAITGAMDLIRTHVNAAYQVGIVNGKKGMLE